jgi:hypothetical protein
MLIGERLGEGIAMVVVAQHREAGLPWRLVLCLFVLLGLGYEIGPLSVTLYVLWLPAAAWLGWRYGERGVAIIAVAGLPLLIGITVEGFFTANWVGLYVAALIICRLVALSSYREGCLAAERVTWRMLAFLFLALSSDAYFQYGGGDPSLDLSTGLGPYLWLLLLVLGLSAAPLRPVLACLILAAVAGLLLRILGAQLPSLAGFGVAYRIAGLQEIATGAAALLAGRLLRRALVGGEPLPAGLSGKGTLLALLLLSLLLSMLELRVPALADGRTVSLRFSTGAATAFLLFACGLAGGGRIAALASLVWLAACLVLPPLLAELHPAGTYEALRFGPFFVSSPRVFISTSLVIAPGLAIALLDPLFALFGWRLGRQLAGRVVPAPASAALPPPFRFRFLDLAASVAGGLILLGTLLLGAMQLVDR